jgi:predicted transcriptional regulator
LKGEITMKIENVINLAAVAIISAHLAKKAQEKKDIRALDEALNQIIEELKTPKKEKFSYSKHSDYIRQRPYVADEIIVSTRKEGEEVLDELGDILRKYGQVSVADFYELVGIPSNYTDNKRGWKELRYTGLHKSRYGYTFSLPDPIDL